MEYAPDTYILVKNIKVGSFTPSSFRSMLIAQI